MSTRSLVTTIASSTLALVLLVVLFMSAHVNMTQILGLLADIRLLPFLALVLLAGLHVLFAGEKWRLVERRLVPDTEFSRRLCFSLTAMGMAAGQVLPMQVATALTRSLASRVLTGSGAVRSALATVFEQMFDIAVVVLCGLASVYVLWSGELGSWAGGAGAGIILGLLFVGPLTKSATVPVIWLATIRTAVGGKIARLSRTLAQSELFEEQLARRLFVLSVLRFTLLWLMAIVVKEAAGLDVSNLQLAAALPLVVLASVFAVTPANIGVNEWTFAAALTAFGTDFDVAAQFALVNRVLVVAAALTIGAAGAILAQGAGKDAASAATLKTIGSIARD